MSDRNELSHRDFITGTTPSELADATNTRQTEDFSYLRGNDTIRVGLIGCGGRGTGAAVNSADAFEGVEIVAMGDLFRNRLESSKESLQAEIGEQFKVTEKTSFTGFDAYQRVLETDVDYVILATPPGFRPLHIRAALEADTHVFAEKPIAVDSAGVRSVMESGTLAEEKNLALVAGTQRRHDPRYIETIQQIHDGAIGDVRAAQIIRSTGPLWLRERLPGMSDMEWQCRNWYYFTWLSGDHVVEMHIHSIDVINWVFQAHPIRAVGVGGRQQRVEPSFGHIYDHLGIEYEYPNGARVICMQRQMGGSSSVWTEHVVGSEGRADLMNHTIRGTTNWSFDRDNPPNAYVQEHANLIESIRSGHPINEGKRVAESTLTAIMAREVAYTGRDLTWEEVLSAEMNLLPAKFEFGSAPFPAVAMPGSTTLDRQWGA
jgi:predicted dehydrogenase